MKAEDKKINEKYSLLISFSKKKKKQTNLQGYSYQNSHISVLFTLKAIKERLEQKGI